jgi:hypothetical protein
MKCYCGCGRNVGFGRRSANKFGAQVQACIQELDALSGEARASMDPTKAAAFEQDLIAPRLSDGERHDKTCRRFVHKEIGNDSVNWLVVRRWIQDVRGMSAMLRLPPDQQRAIMGD